MSHFWLSTNATKSNIYQCLGSGSNLHPRLSKLTATFAIYLGESATPRRYWSVFNVLATGFCYIYLADNAWTRNLTCRFLVVKVRPQSQGIDFAALVAFAFIDRLVSILDIEGKLVRNNKWLGPWVDT